MQAGSIVEKLREVHDHSRKAIEAGEREDWSTAEQELHKAQAYAATAVRLVELASDMSRVTQALKQQ
jgi:DNA-binding GntR family transcriptional regulator